MSYSGTDPESYITEYTCVYEETTDSGLAERRALGGVPREQTMLKGQVSGVVYHQVH